jgi:NADH dehydrogenase
MFQGTVTIFGGSGFIGRYIVARLADRGWTIRVAVRHPGQAEFLRPLGDVGQIVPLRAPLQQPEAVRAALRGSDAAVNLAGILHQSGRQRFAGVHVEGARLIAEAAAAEGIERLLHLSALGASETSPAAYARSKAAGEKAVRAALPQATILRPSVVFGPEDDFFNRFAAMARLSPALPLIGGGRTRFQPVYVGDVADAAVAALLGAQHRGKTFELGGPRVYSFEALMRFILETVGRRRLLLALPYGLAELLGGVMELLPAPPLTRDQVLMLRRDNVVSEGAPGLAELGITARSVEALVPPYLQRYRRGGRRLDDLGRRD